jgi:hypothetical protein
VWRSHGQEAKRGEASGHRIPWNCEAIGPFTSRVRHRVVPDRDRVPDRCNTSGSAVDVCMTLSHGRHGLRARRMAVWYTWRAPSLCRHVHRELMRSALLDLTPIIAATTCNQRNYVERYSRFRVVPYQRPYLSYLPPRSLQPYFAPGDTDVDTGGEFAPPFFHPRRPLSPRRSQPSFYGLLQSA